MGHDPRDLVLALERFDGGETMPIFEAPKRPGKQSWTERRFHFLAVLWANHLEHCGASARPPRPAVPTAVQSKFLEMVREDNAARALREATNSQYVTTVVDECKYPPGSVKYEEFHRAA